MAPITCRLSSCASSCRAAAARAQLLPQSKSHLASIIVREECRALLPRTFSRPITSSHLPSRQGRSQRPKARSRLLQPPSPNRTTSQASTRRSYHSYDHPTSETPFSPTERAILTAAYAHVPEHGFSQKALALGALDAGYLDISTNLLPDGVFSLIQWHLVSRREALAVKAQELFSNGQEGIAVGRRVELLTWERLMGNREVIGRWQEALAVMAQPSYVPESLKELAKLADEIWFLVGDTSVDPSWYTKRASLSAIYASAELLMTTDNSEGFIETRKFLRRRLEEAQGLGGTLRSLGQWVGFTANAGLNVLRSKGMRI